MDKRDIYKIKANLAAMKTKSAIDAIYGVTPSGKKYVYKNKKKLQKIVDLANMTATIEKQYEKECNRIRLLRIANVARGAMASCMMLSCTTFLLKKMFSE